MKLTDNKKKVLQVRVTEEELTLLKVASVSIGLTPSKLVRMFIDSTCNALKIKIDKGVINLEDYKAILND